MRRLNSKGYTFAEVLVASAIIGLVIGSAVSMAGTMNMQIESSRLSAIGINYAENAARLLQLGQTPDVVQSLLPTVNHTNGTAAPNPDLSAAIIPVSNGIQVTFAATEAITMANTMGTVDKVNVSVTIRNLAGGTSPNRTYTISTVSPQLK